MHIDCDRYGIISRGRMNPHLFLWAVDGVDLDRVLVRPDLVGRLLRIRVAGFGSREHGDAVADEAPVKLLKFLCELQLTVL